MAATRDAGAAGPAWGRPGTVVAADAGTDPDRGLTGAEAERRLAVAGPNALPAPHAPGRAVRLGRQVANPMTALLAVAAAVSAAVSDALDTVVILAVVAINTVLGYVQEARSDEAAAALRRLLVVRARVIRDGAPRDVDAAGVVPGDVVALRAGDRVPADARLVEALDLEVDESTLTGESLPVGKRAEPPAPADAPLADRRTMLHAATTVTRGAARAVVVATGPATVVGTLAADPAPPPPTPLQRRIDRLSAWLMRAALVVLAACTALAVLAGGDVGESLLVGVSLAVAAVPEGLPAVLTVTLALGVRRMAEDGAIVRRLAAVEALGSTTVVCSDKTGTLTENRMSVTRVHGASAADGDDRVIAVALAASPDADDPRAAPEEAAIATAARDAGIAPDGAASGGRRVRVLPFSSDRRRVAVIAHDAAGTGHVYVKGAPEAVLTRLATPRPDLQRLAREWAADGVRVLAIAERTLPGEAGDPEAALEAVGLVGLSDPPREHIRARVAEARRAGVRTIMVTGDHPGTAVAMARAIGILRGDDRTVLTGADIDRLSPAALREAVAQTGVFARVEPRHKPMLVNALRDDGEIVAMTGDGVNDVSALRAADVGVAMGKRGTDAATGAADIVLTDDDYGTIVRAIGGGRAIYDDVVRFVHFLLAANLGEVIVFALALLAGFGAPLTVTQILVVNLLTDGPPAVALAFDPPAADVMRRPPRPPGEGILSPIRGRLLAGAAATGAAGFASFLAGNTVNADTGRTTAFVTLVLAQLAYVFAVRGDAPAWRAGRNRRLTAAVAGCAAALVAALAIGPVADALGVVSVGAGLLALAVALAGVPAAVGELEKWARRSRGPGADWCGPTNPYSARLRTRGPRGRPNPARARR